MPSTPPRPRQAYLDYNATAPLRPEARTALLGALEAVSHAVIDGHTSIGARVQVYPFATIGLPVRYHNREFQMTVTVNLTGWLSDRLCARGRTDGPVRCCWFPPVSSHR